MHYTSTTKDVSYTIPGNIDNRVHYISSNYTGTDPQYPTTDIYSILSTKTPFSTNVILNHDSTESNKGRDGYKAIETRDNTGTYMSALELWNKICQYSIYDSNGTYKYTAELHPQTRTTAATNNFESLLNDTLGQSIDWIVNNKLPTVNNGTAEIFYHNSYGVPYFVALMVTYSQYYSMFMFSYDGTAAIAFRENDVKGVYSLTGLYPGVSPLSVIF